MKTDIVIEAKTKKYHLRYRHCLTWAARKNRHLGTEAEKIIWDNLLKGKQLGFKFTRQKPIDRFILDFYCSDLCLAIEIDGPSHKNKIGRDRLRDKYLRSCGITTIRFNNNDILYHLDQVKLSLINFIQSSPLPCQGKGVRD